MWVYLQVGSYIASVLVGDGDGYGVGYDGTMGYIDEIGYGKGLIDI